MAPEPSRRTAVDPNPSRSPLEVNVPPDAWDRFLANLKTEPLKQGELAGHFGVGRNKIRSVLRTIAAVERVPGGWRVPLGKMPPSYLVALGLFSPRA